LFQSSGKPDFSWLRIGPNEVIDGTAENVSPAFGLVLATIRNRTRALVARIMSEAEVARALGIDLRWSDLDEH
jgi:hypothetical protein